MGPRRRARPFKPDRAGADSSSVSASPRHSLEGLGAGEIALTVLRILPAASALVFDRDLRYVLAGGHALEHEGLHAVELEGMPAEEVLLDERWETYEPLYRAALAGETRSLEVWSADDTRCYQVEVGPLRGGAGEIVGGVAVSRDITPRKHAEEARRHAQERFELVFEQAPIGMALLTPEGRWVRVNSALLTITGYTSEELLAKSLEEITHPDDLSADLEYVRRLLAGEISHYEMERRYFHARGHVISTVLSVSVMRDRQGRPQHFIAQIQDITERKLIEERLRHLAEHDSLTGLHNRRLLERQLAMQVARCRRYGEQAALLVLDLDGFKAVNDTYGHRVGDELLQGSRASSNTACAAPTWSRATAATSSRCCSPAPPRRPLARSPPCSPTRSPGARWKPTAGASRSPPRWASPRSTRTPPAAKRSWWRPTARCTRRRTASGCTPRGGEGSGWRPLPAVRACLRA